MDTERILLTETPDTTDFNDSFKKLKQLLNKNNNRIKEQKERQIIYHGVDYLKKNTSAETQVI